MGLNKASANVSLTISATCTITLYKTTQARLGRYKSRPGIITALGRTQDIWMDDTPPFHTIHCTVSTRRRRRGGDCLCHLDMHTAQHNTWGTWTKMRVFFLLLVYRIEIECGSRSALKPWLDSFCQHLGYHISDASKAKWGRDSRKPSSSRQLGRLVRCRK